LVLDNVIQATERDEFSYDYRDHHWANINSGQLPGDDHPPRHELPPQP
jgi:hypothetical protein